MQKEQKEVCVLNMDSSACHFSTMVGIVAFIASIGFLVGEWYALFIIFSYIFDCELRLKCSYTPVYNCISEKKILKRNSLNLNQVHSQNQIFTPLLHKLD